MLGATFEDGRKIWLEVGVYELELNLFCWIVLGNYNAKLKVLLILPRFDLELSSLFEQFELIKLCYAFCWLEIESLSDLG